MPRDPVGYVITQVAARTGQAVAAVFEAPYGLTLWTFVQFQDADRIARVLAKIERLALARYIAFAMWAPKELDRIERDEMRSETRDGIAARETRLIAQARQIVAQRRRP